MVVARSWLLPAVLLLLMLGLTTIDARTSRASSEPTEASLLLSLLEGRQESWDNVTASLPGAPWAAGTDPCGESGGPAWKGVTCGPDGSVTELSVGGLKIRGQLPGALAALPSLRVLDLKCNALVGSVPPEWRAPGAFPSLQTLVLFDNLLTGSLADFTLPGGKLPAARLMNLSRNSINGGPLPPGWHSPTLQALDISLNMVPGELPAAWAQPVGGQRSHFPALSALLVQGNNLTGPYGVWPAGTFAPNFTLVARPGNGLMEGAPLPSPVPDQQAPASEGSSGGGLSAGAIAGMAVGAAAGTALLAGLAAFAVTRRRKQRRGVAQAAAPAGGKPGEGWGKDVEAGGLSSGPSSTWTSLSTSAPARGSGSGHGAGAGSATGRSSPTPTVLDSACGSLCGSGSERGEGSSRGSRGGGSAVQSVRASLPLSLDDTDAARLPGQGGWSSEVEFSDLELSHVLGRGSFGAVYLAKYCQTTVAVKMLGGERAPEVADSKHHREVIRQLEKEAGIMRELRHTNVCLYMGACLAPPCLLMEYCSRRSVDKILSAGLRDAKVAKQLTWPRLLGMALDAARGLLYLHTRSSPVYHRDFKSANLLVTASWQVKVADFNLSRAQEASGVMSSVCIQNPRWLSPERLAGASGGLSADVYAFGVVLHELATWEAPYGEQNAYQIIHSVQASPSGSGLAPPPADQLPAGRLGQYRAYVELMEACWARCPEERPGMEEVVRRLRNILAAELGRPVSQSGSLSQNASISLLPSGSLPQPSPFSGAPWTAYAGSLHPPGASLVSSGSAGAGGAAGGTPSPFSASQAAAAPAETDAGMSPFVAAGVAAAQDAGLSPFGAAAAAEPEAPPAASPFEAAAAAGPAADKVGASPFGAAAASMSPFEAAADAEPSPFGASAFSPFAAATEDCSPFAAAQAQEAEAPDAASPFAAAAALPADRQGSVQVPQHAQQAQQAGFDDMANSVLASFARMEHVQRQLSRGASSNGGSGNGRQPSRRLSSSSLMGPGQ